MLQDHHWYRNVIARLRAARFSTAALLLGSVIVLSGCSLPDSFARSGEKRYIIEMSQQNRFEPSSVTVPVGSTVVWENASDGPHTATLVTSSSGAAMATAEATPVEHEAPSENSQSWNSGDLYPGDIWMMTFDEPGDYLFICQRHGDEGMMGVVRVWDPDAS